ncbi:hypothetical protein [Methylocapsa sp. S129]|uniref:hypothetical protein n=1 Tax=Methylocapsa sp. S129 TaxID=1641869 RepID=UPI00131E463C|nr:hypothetical protein [Methylocapsa sp. S129]
MDEKKTDHLKSVPPSLTAAIRRARIEGAEQNQAVADLRETEIARLELLEEAVRPVLEQTPSGIDLFDAGIAYGERPRLFIDMIGFVEMGHDRRTYRFLQDTRHGRVLIAETERIDRVVAAITNYIGRRLVERERALASDWRSKEGEPSPSQSRARAAGLAKAAEQGRPSADATIAEAKASAAVVHAPEAPRSWLTRASDLFSFVLLVLGSMTFCLLIGVAAYAVWDTWGRALWTAWIGPAPF